MKRKPLGLLVALSLAVFAGRGAWAATPDPRVVVVADAAGDETENAKLRARVYESTREKGLTPEPKADVAGKASETGAMEAGQITIDEQKLQALRTALGVGTLVRVAASGAGVRIFVVTASGVKSQDVASVDAAPAAVAEMLASPSKAAPTPAPQPTPGPSEGTAESQPVSVGFMLPAKKDEGPPPDSPQAIRAAWENRGGVRASYGVRALVTAVMIENFNYSDQNPDSGQLEVGKKTAYGIGAGLGAHLSMMYLPLPQPAEGGKNWQAFRIGVGLDLSGLYVRPPDGFKYNRENGVVVSRDTTYANKAYIYGVTPLQLGVHFGFGDFRAPTLWRGFALGVAYSPAFVTSLEVGQDQDKATTVFNYGGFELSVDLVKLESDKGSGPQMRLSVLALPRVKDDVPWLVSPAIGAVWY